MAQYYLCSLVEGATNLGVGRYSFSNALLQTVTDKDTLLSFLWQETLLNVLG